MYRERDPSLRLRRPPPARRSLLLTHKRIRGALPLIQHIRAPDLALLLAVRRAKQVERELRVAHARVRRHTARVDEDARGEEDGVRDRQPRRAALHVGRVQVRGGQVGRVVVRACVRVRVVLRLVRLPRCDGVGLRWGLRGFWCWCWFGRRLGSRSTLVLARVGDVGALCGRRADIGLDDLHALLRLPQPEVAAEPRLCAIQAWCVRVTVRDVCVAGGGVVVVDASAVGDTLVVRLRGVDDVGAGLTTEDLERQMLCVALCTCRVARGYGGEGGFGDRGRLGLTELVAVDVARTPAATELACRQMQLAQ